ncbi:hypothetical protein JL720_4281 [Aureococcus anophagefferens]|nr:hypothetical protein JL720_4281 [Aureococcus anophagefferens]
MLGQPGGEAYDAPSEGPSALSHLLRVVNVGLSVMMAATGASSLASSGAVNGNQLSQDVVSLYLLLFSAMWFTFEASQVYPCDAVVAQLKRNFGFLYNAIGKALFVIFCGFLNFGVQAHTLGLVTGILCCCEGVVLIVLYLKYPHLFPK